MNSNPFDLGYIFDSPTDIGTYGWIYFGVATVGMLIANFFYFYGKYRFKSNLLTYTVINRASRSMAIVFTLGFLFMLSRFVMLPPFNSRVFLYATLILFIYYVVRGIGYLLRTYPKAKAEWQNRKDRENKTATKAAPAVRPATKPIATSTLATSSADAGGDENIEKLPEQGTPVVRQGLSERGLKRRERKRNRR